MFLRNVGKHFTRVQCVTTQKTTIPSFTGVKTTDLHVGHILNEVCDFKFIVCIPYEMKCGLPVVNRNVSPLSAGTVTHEHLEVVECPHHRNIWSQIPT
jgi:hypothetical protein